MILLGCNGPHVHQATIQLNMYGSVFTANLHSNLQSLEDLATTLREEWPVEDQEFSRSLILSTPKGVEDIPGARGNSQVLTGKM